MDCSLPGSCVHGILKARILEWLATPLQGIFPTQGSNLGFWHCRWVLYHLSHLGGSWVSSDFIHCRSQASLSHIQPTSSESEKCNPTSTLIKVPVLMLQFSSVQLLSHVQIFVTPMDCSRQGPPVHHQLLEFTQTQVHWVSDAIQPSHPLLSPSPPALVFPSIRVFSNESVLHIRWPNYRSFIFSISPPDIQDWFPLGWICWISLQSKGLSRVFSNTTVQKRQFFGAQISL